MPKSKPPYPAEFRQQIIELARTGRTPAELSREFDPTAQSIANWIAQDARDRGKALPGKEGLTTAEREELSRLRKQVRQFMPRIRAELRAAGHVVGRKRVARLMRQARIRGISRRRGYVVTTERNVRQRPAPDLVSRRFRAEARDQLWVADMTYAPTWSGFLYLAVVLDAFSRKVVGWSMGEQMTADLVLSALNMALHTRKPESVIHHSDQRSQYTSLSFGNRCREMGVKRSMGTVGDAYDNARDMRNVLGNFSRRGVRPPRHSLVPGDRPWN